MAWSLCCPRDSQESSPAPQFKSISSLVLSLLYGLPLTSIHDYRKNHSFDYTDFVVKVISDVPTFLFLKSSPVKSSFIPLNMSFSKHKVSMKTHPGWGWKWHKPKAQAREEEEQISPSAWIRGICFPSLLPSPSTVASQKWLFCN